MSQGGSPRPIAASPCPVLHGRIGIAQVVQYLPLIRPLLQGTQPVCRGFGIVTGGKLRSLRGYRRLLRGSGFEPIASYFVLQKPGAAPSRIISTACAPSTAFFSHQIATLTGPKRFLMRGLNALNLLPHVQSRFLILARK